MKSMGRRGPPKWGETPATSTCQKTKNDVRGGLPRKDETPGVFFQGEDYPGLQLSLRGGKKMGKRENYKA